MNLEPSKVLHKDTTNPERSSYEDDDLIVISDKKDTLSSKNFSDDEQLYDLKSLSAHILDDLPTYSQDSKAVQKRSQDCESVSPSSTVVPRRSRILSNCCDGGGGGSAAGAKDLGPMKLSDLCFKEEIDWSEHITSLKYSASDKRFKESNVNESFNLSSQPASTSVVEAGTHQPSTPPIEQ